MIKKVIGFILVLVIFYLAIKALVFLPSLSNLAIGPNKSPFQVGADYIDQVNTIYPYNNQGRAKKISTVYNSDTNTNIVRKVTLEKLNGKLILSVEAANPRNELNIWLTNTSEVTSETEYIDFGTLLKNEAITQYTIDMKGKDISFAEYKYVLLVDVKAGYQMYARILLK